MGPEGDTAALELGVNLRSGAGSEAPGPDE